MNAIAGMLGFQSTSLSRGKTSVMAVSRYSASLSIHFPLTREDSVMAVSRYSASTFNPLPSHEGRRRTDSLTNQEKNLSIHFPLTREDKQSYLSRTESWLSIHFPLTREDLRGTLHIYILRIFQSTSLSRGKTNIDEH